MLILSHQQMLSRLKQLDNTYVRSIVLFSLPKILNNAAPVILLLFFSRELTHPRFLSVSLLLSFISFLILLGDFGFSDALKRFLSDHPISKILSPILIYSTVLNLAISIPLFLVDTYTGIMGNIGLWIIVISMLSVISYFVYTFAGKLRFAEAGAIVLFSSILFIILTLFFYKSNIPAVYSIVSARVISWGVPLLFLSLAFAHRGYIKPIIALPKRINIFISNIFFFTIAEIFITQFDVVLIGILVGNRFLKIYELPSALGNIPIILAIAFGASLVPIISNYLKKKKVEEVKEFIYALEIFLLGASTLMIFILTILSRYVLSSVIGGDIRGEFAFRVFLFSLITSVIYVLSVPLQSYFVAREKDAFIRNVSLLRIGIFTFLAVPMTLIFSLDGFSLAILVAYAATLFVYLNRFWSEIKWMKIMQLETFNTSEIMPLKRNTKSSGGNGELINNTFSQYDIKVNHFFYARIPVGDEGGNHYHIRSTRWLVVQTSKAEIILEDVETKKQRTYIVDSTKPQIITMKPLNSVKFKNIGKEELVLLVLSDKAYNAGNSDTYPYEII